MLMEGNKTSITLREDASLHFSAHIHKDGENYGLSRYRCLPDRRCSRRNNCPHTRNVRRYHLFILLRQENLETICSVTPIYEDLHASLSNYAKIFDPIKPMEHGAPEYQRSRKSPLNGSGIQCVQDVFILFLTQWMPSIVSDPCSVFCVRSYDQKGHRKDGEMAALASSACVIQNKNLRQWCPPKQPLEVCKFNTLFLSMQSEKCTSHNSEDMPNQTPR